MATYLVTDKDIHDLLTGLGSMRLDANGHNFIQQTVISWQKGLSPELEKQSLEIPKEAIESIDKV